MIIRPAVEADAEQLSRLFVELDEHHIRRTPWEFKALNGPARSVEHLVKMLRLPESVVLIADDGDAGIIGLAHVHIREFPETIVAPCRRVAEIDSLVVSRERRRRGVGVKLLQAARVWAAGNGLDVLELSVRGSNTEALAFYKSEGFEVISWRLRQPTEA